MTVVASAGASVSVAESEHAGENPQAELQRLNEFLEKRVAERTRELAAINQALQTEISERRSIEADLLRARRELELRVQARTAELAVATEILQGEMLERKRLERSILEVSEREKRRIAQDLHDGLGQHLTGIAFLSKVLERKLEENASPHAGDAMKIGELVNDAIDQTRELAKGLLPVQAKPNGLASALEHLVAEIQDVFPVSCVLRGSDHVLIDDVDSASHLYRIAQEAVTNAVKHGRASELAIDLRQSEHELILRIRDNGIGFAKVLEPTQGMGLRLMKYRANMIGGTLEIEQGSAPGTCVVCRVALSRRSQPL